MNNKNKYIIDQLTEVKNRQKIPHFVRAYREAIHNLSIFPKPIDTFKEAKDLQGIGPGIAKHVAQFATDYDNMNRRLDKNRYSNSIYNQDDEVDVDQVQLIDDGDEDHDKVASNKRPGRPRRKQNVVEEENDIEEQEQVEQEQVQEEEDEEQETKPMKKRKTTSRKPSRAIETDSEENEYSSETLKELYNELLHDDRIKFLNSRLIPFCQVADIRKKAENKTDNLLQYLLKRKIDEITTDKNSILAAVRSEEDDDKQYRIEIRMSDVGMITLNRCQCMYGKSDQQWCKHKLSVFSMISQSNGTNKIALDVIGSDSKRTRKPAPNSPPLGTTIRGSRKTAEPAEEKLPEHNTSQYWILYAMYKETLHEDYNGSLTRDQIMYLANKHIPSAISEHTFGQNFNKLKSKSYVREVETGHYELAQKGQVGGQKIYTGVHPKPKPLLTTSDVDAQPDDQEETDLFSNPLIRDNDDQDDLMALDQHNLYEWSDEDEDTTQYMLEHSVLTNKEIQELLYNEKEITVNNVRLIIDNREFKPNNNNNNKDALLKKLGHEKIEPSIETLPLGDIVWVANVHFNNDPHKKDFDLLFDFIIERKKLPDLVASLRDGRYENQKFRLKKCGISNIIYLIEGNNAKNAIVGPDKFDEIIFNTQVNDGFIVKLSDSVDETATFLSETLDMFKNKPFRFLSSVRLADFKYMQENSQATLQEIFFNQLMQMPKIDKAKAMSIVKVYKTPFNLYNEYQQFPENDQPTLLSSMLTGDKKSIINEQLSSFISQFYNKDDY
ncbi:hypothetical protein CYY_003458 [Polysphondylium violaceum]|uniref:Crossover junction endonuclease MUS81 n=1 Tax=Polysphondylium violaceum TaxID=133409 RepID=A0A8J4V071_9MYCE|nr:hypothetical protein CYY_003458 [Polysphondylium violaceum]